MSRRGIMPSLPMREVGDGIACIDLATAVGSELDRMPYVHRILIENILRGQPADEAKEAIAAFRAWLSQGRSEREIRILPNRILMHDTTCGPALVDIAAMRDVLAEAGVNPRRLNPVLPVATSTDHSVAVDRFGRPDALSGNLEIELSRNAERYRFMRWAGEAIDGFRVFPPGSGIMHTINMERLAEVTVVDARIDGTRLAFPDMLVGTDSHTPMINSMGVLGWGVGGIEAEGVMFGLPISIRMPDVVGVRLIGTLPEGVLATDLALQITHLIRAASISGEFVEFFGPGVSTLTVGQRAVVANMAPEYGATTGFFAIDDKTIDYLHLTGRSAERVDLVAAQAKAQHLWFDPEIEPRYSRILQFDLSSLSLTLAGPKRPQDRLSSVEAKSILAIAPPDNSCMPRDAVAIAAIASCTNTTDPGLLIAAGLLARNARERGLSVQPWVKTSLTPGSPATARRLERVGLLSELEGLGFAIVGHGCATCIGNSGPLQEEMAKAVAAGAVEPIAVLSGNRNFPGRVHTQIDRALLASPPVVVAFALVGKAGVDIASDPLGLDSDGGPVVLADIWPTAEEIEQLTAQSWNPADVADAYRAAEAAPFWHDLETPRGARFAWDEESTYLRRPPFVTLPKTLPLPGVLSVRPLISLGDDITTDHISPAGAIPERSDAGQWLIANGEDAHDLNVYASRRGNWEVMLRGLFTNRNTDNLLGDGLKGGLAIDPSSGETLPIWRLAERFAQRNEAACIVAGERYGTGSSRDWAAKGVQLLGVRVLLANSLERIHRSNLIGMGVLPIRLPDGWRPATLGLEPGDWFDMEWNPEHWEPRLELGIALHRRSGGVERGIGVAFIETHAEVDLLRAGGMIPKILMDACRMASNA